MMFRTVTIMLTLCVSGGHCKYDCPYTNSTIDDECPYPAGSMCQCCMGSVWHIGCAGNNFQEQLTALPATKVGATAKDYPVLYIAKPVNDQRLKTIDVSVPQKLEKFICNDCPFLTDISAKAFEGSESTLKYILVRNAPMDNLNKFVGLHKLGALETLIWRKGPGGVSGDALKHANFNSNPLPLAKSLVRLDLGGNKLTQVPEGVSKLIKLSCLNLGDNKITQLTSASFPSSLEELSIHRNKIGRISFISFQGGTSKLKTLELLGNPITYISERAFQQLSKLESLTIGDHNLKKIPLALTSLTSLSYLDIQPEVINLQDDHKIPFDCHCDEEDIVSNWGHDGASWLHAYDLAKWFADVKPTISRRGTCMNKGRKISIWEYFNNVAPRCFNMLYHGAKFNDAACPIVNMLVLFISVFISVNLVLVYV